MLEHFRKFFDAVDTFGEMEVNVNPKLTIMLIQSLHAGFENFRRAIVPQDEPLNPKAYRIKIIEERLALKCIRGIPQKTLLSDKQKRDIRFNKVLRFTHDKNRKNGKRVI